MKSIIQKAPCFQIVFFSLSILTLEKELNIIRITDYEVLK